MNEKKISWCCRQKRGINILEKKPHLEESYKKESLEDLEQIEKANDKWKAIIAYYSCYESVYSLLMKCGIKSEIHECTLALMDILGFDEKDKEFLQELKELREKSQYYLKREDLNVSEVKEFIRKCGEISLSLNSEKINRIREKIKNIKEIENG